MKKKMNRNSIEPSDRGGEALILPLGQYVLRNDAFRRALYTGEHLQLTEMCVAVGDHIGAESHSQTDQMICIVEGEAAVYVGTNPQDATLIGTASGGDAILIPAGTFHDLLNAGRTPLRLFSVYAPPSHPYGTVEQTRPTED